MKNLKENLQVIYYIIEPFLKLLIGVAILGFLVNGMVYFAIKIDTSRLGEIRHCPSCGIDLLNLN